MKHSRNLILTIGLYLFALTASAQNGQLVADEEVPQQPLVKPVDRAVLFGEHVRHGVKAERFAARRHAQPSEQQIGVCFVDAGFERRKRVFKRYSLYLRRP